MTQPALKDAADSEVVMISRLLREPNLGRQLVGGYATGETDALLQRAAATIDRLRNALSAARQEPDQQEPASVQGVAEPAPSSPPDVHALGGLMVTAHEAIELLKQKTEHQSRQVIEDAHAEAASIVAEAAKERTRLEGETLSAQRVIDAARTQAASIVEQANRERTRILADTEQLRRTAEQLRHTWITQFSQMIDQLGDSRQAATAGGVEASHPIERDLIERLPSESAPPVDET